MAKCQPSAAKPLTRVISVGMERNVKDLRCVVKDLLSYHRSIQLRSSLIRAKKSYSRSHDGNQYRESQHICYRSS